jgi:hypothetical protein
MLRGLFVVKQPTVFRREGIAQNLYYRWSKDFLEAGKKRLAVTRLVPQLRTRSRICGVRRPRSRRLSLI